MKKRFVQAGLWAVAGFAVVMGAAGLLMQDGVRARAEDPTPYAKWQPACDTPSWALEEWSVFPPQDDCGGGGPTGARLEEW